MPADENLSLERYQQALTMLALPRFAPRPPGAPFIVAVEGPNGAGKSTLCAALAASLRVPSCLGIDPAWFARDFKTRMIRDAEWFASAMFFLSGCLEQMRALRSSAAPLVIMDRSLWSTLAVHAAESIQRLEALLAMLGPIAGEIRVPDFTLVLEATLVTCQARSSRKESNSRALDELTASRDYHLRERAFYRWLSLQGPRVQFLDVNAPTAAEACVAALARVREVAPEAQRP